MLRHETRQVGRGLDIPIKVNDTCRQKKDDEFEFTSCHTLLHAPVGLRCTYVYIHMYISKDVQTYYYLCTVGTYGTDITNKKLDPMETRQPPQEDAAQQAEDPSHSGRRTIQGRVLLVFLIFIRISWMSVKLGGREQCILDLNGAGGKIWILPKKLVTIVDIGLHASSVKVQIVLTGLTAALPFAIIFFKHITGGWYDGEPPFTGARSTSTSTTTSQQWTRRAFLILRILLCHTLCIGQQVSIGTIAF